MKTFILAMLMAIQAFAQSGTIPESSPSYYSWKQSQNRVHAVYFQQIAGVQAGVQGKKRVAFNIKPSRELEPGESVVLSIGVSDSQFSYADVRFGYDGFYGPPHPTGIFAAPVSLGNGIVQTKTTVYPIMNRGEEIPPEDGGATPPSSWEIAEKSITIEAPVPSNGRVSLLIMHTKVVPPGSTSVVPDLDMTFSGTWEVLDGNFQPAIGLSPSPSGHNGSVSAAFAMNGTENYTFFSLGYWGMTPPTIILQQKLQDGTFADYPNASAPYKIQHNEVSNYFVQAVSAACLDIPHPLPAGEYRWKCVGATSIQPLIGKIAK